MERWGIVWGNDCIEVVRGTLEQATERRDQLEKEWGIQHGIKGMHLARAMQDKDIPEYSGVTVK